MTQEREILLQDLLDKIDDMIATIEEREVVEPDFAVVREYAEQLREEISALQE